MSFMLLAQIFAQTGFYCVAKKRCYLSRAEVFLIVVSFCLQQHALLYQMFSAIGSLFVNNILGVRLCDKQCVSFSGFSALNKKMY